VEAWKRWQVQRLVNAKPRFIPTFLWVKFPRGIF
jgi:hypothetical protein